MKELFRWGGALVFVFSLLSMPAMYIFRLRTPAPDDGSAVRDALANVTLFTIFALHHSIMACAGAKAWLKRSVAPDLERSVYVWVVSTAYMAIAIPFEERSLVDSFGDRYRVYQSQVRWRLVPGLW